MADAFPAADVRQALSTVEVAPYAVDSWAAEGTCFAAVSVGSPQGWADETVLLRSDDGGASWRSLGRLSGNFGGVVLRGRALQWVWTRWQSEGTFSTPYRFDGERLLASDTFDAALRTRGGCCFTGIDAIVLADRTSAAFLVHGLDDGPSGAPNAGWFETTDGGAHFTWVGVDLTDGWKRVAALSTALEPVPKACAEAAAGFVAR